MIKICEICGTEFETKMSNAKYCSRKCHNANSSRVYYARKTGKLPPAEPKGKKFQKVNAELVRLSKEAREHGMSYGKYVAMLERGAR